MTMPINAPPRLNFLTGFVLDMLPSGLGEAMALPFEAKLQMLQDRAARRRLDEWSQQPNQPVPLGDWGARRIVEAFTPETKRFEGRLVREIAAEQGKDEFDALVDIACADGLRTTFELPRSDTEVTGKRAFESFAIRELSCARSTLVRTST